MNSPAYIIAKYLESLGVGTVGTDIFVGKEPETAGTIATLYDTGGRDPMHNLCADPDSNTWQPSVQLRVRADSYPTAFARISALRRSILGLTGYSITEVVAGVQTKDSVLDTIGRSDIISIGDDANNRPVLTANFDLLFSSHSLSVDKSALQSALTAAGALTESDYTPESWAVLADAVTSGQGVYDDPSATQEQVDDATQAITSAIDGLVPVPVGCTSCLGAWDGSLATSLGGISLDVTGTCGHSLATPAGSGAGFYLATAPSASPIPISWASSELRVLSFSSNVLATVGAKSVSLAVSAIKSDFSTSFAVWHEYDGATTTVHCIGTVFNSAGGKELTELSHVGAPLPLVVGIAGDGRVYVAHGTAYHKSENLWTGNIILGSWMRSDLTGAWTTQASSTALTDAASMPTVPDMSADGITAVKDFCGNVVVSLLANYAARSYRAGGMSQTFAQTHTLTRSTPRYVWDASGQLVSIAANQPCYEYDPATGEAKGLFLNPESVTNICVPSYVSGGAGVTITPCISIFGAANAAYKVESVTNNVSQFNPALTSSGMRYVCGAILEQGNAAASNLGIYNRTTSSYVSQADFNWASKTFSANTGTDPSKSQGAQKLLEVGPNGGEVWHIWVSADIPAGNQFSGAYRDGAVNLGTGEYSYVHFHGLSTAYPIAHSIPTASVAVTCAADVCDLAALPTDYGTIGCFVINYSDPFIGSAIREMLGDGANAFFQLSADNLTVSATDGTNTASTSVTATGKNKVAVAWDATTIKICANGGTVVTATHNGNLGTFASPPRLARGVASWYSLLQYLPSTNTGNVIATDAKMQELTT